MEILKYRQDANSPWVEIAAITGTPGKDGTNGKDGKDGINGKDGVDGYTPVKGVDYFDGEPGKDGEDYVLTEADKEEIAGLVLASIPVSEEVSF